MKNNQLLWWAFAAMAILQLGFPLNTVYQHELTLHSGNVYKFPTIPVDPNDPFRGKYVALDFPALEAALPTAEIQRIANSVDYGQTVYLRVRADERGYVQATGLQTTPPEKKTEDYFAAKVAYVNFAHTDSAHMNLQYPFQRFFMEEFKAPAAEDKYQAALRDSTTEVYALVRIREGIAVLEDVLIAGQSILE